MMAVKQIKLSQLSQLGQLIKLGQLSKLGQLGQLLPLQKNRSFRLNNRSLKTCRTFLTYLANLFLS